MEPFHGEHEITFDEKKRVLLPAEIRRLLDPEKDGNSFFLIRGPNKVPWLFLEKFYKERASTIRPETLPNPHNIDHRHLVWARVIRIELDRQGRLLVPEQAMKRGMRFERESTLVGAMDHLEIWPRSEWDEQYRKLNDNEGALMERIWSQEEKQAEVKMVESKAS